MADIELPAPVRRAVIESWRDRALNNQAVQEPGAQDAFRDGLIRDIGVNWVTLLGRIRDAVAAPPYAVIIRADGAGGGEEAVLAAVAAGIGAMVNPYRERVPGSPVMMEIVAKGPTSPDQVWHWHTDSANWPNPNDYSALTCLRTAPRGGATQILSLDALRARPDWRGEVLVPLWECDLTWPVDGFLGGGTFVDRAIGAHRLRFRRELMTGSGDVDYQRAVREFSRLADASEPDLSALLRPGDLLLFDNRRAMHRAGPVDDPQRERLLLRTKIASRS